MRAGFLDGSGLGDNTKEGNKYKIKKEKLLGPPSHPRNFELYTPLAFPILDNQMPSFEFNNEFLFFFPF